MVEQWRYHGIIIAVDVRIRVTYDRDGKDFEVQKVKSLH